jgi:UDP-N-acetylglucosamine:LPS N-acetylglucosamine transferase
MNQAYNGKKPRKYRILVAPLDWGLGHATRCIPIIKALIGESCDVWLACSGMQEVLLKTEFPELNFLSLPGYQIRYSKTKSGLRWKILFQLPKIFKSIKNENKWLKKIMEKYQFDAVISDNRFGLHNNKIFSVFITHQLSIKSHLGKWSEKILQRWNYQKINFFNECWVPDFAGENNLAGKLSHTSINPKTPVHYIGTLSRFTKFSVEEIKGNLLIILSGPEPQRSILEDKIIHEVSHYNGTATIIRGLTNYLSIVPSTEMIKFYNHLPAKELNEEMTKAEWVICRCGYSSIMDIIKLQKKSILIPTPGQTEQEYLAKYLSQKHFAYCIEQNIFSLSPALQAAKDFPYQFPNINSDDQLKIFIHDFWGRINRLRE